MNTNAQQEQVVQLNLEIGGFRKLACDRKLILDGLTWYRVKGGLGGRDDREDWVLDVPHGQGVVTRWPLSQDRWEHNQYSTRDEAMRAVAASRPGWIEYLITQNEKTLTSMYEGRQRLEEVGLYNHSKDYGR